MAVDQLLFSVLEAYKASLQQQFHRELPQLSLLDFRILRQLHEAGGGTPLQIAQLLMRDKSQVTRLVAELLQRGWLVKQLHPKDKRSVMLQLTTTGAKLVEHALVVEQQVSQRMTTGLATEQLACFEQLLMVLRGNLQT